jgi:hypothetical protein
MEREKANGRPVNIMPHDAMQILGQMSNQKLYVCEQVEGPEPFIVASSILWDSVTPVPCEGGHRGYAAERFLEIGTQVSTIHGFGLQWVLTAVTLMEQLCLDPTGVVFAATYGDNHTAARNFEETMQFVYWKEVPATIESVRLHHLEEGGPAELARGVKWFRPTIETVIAAADLILDLDNNPNRQVKLGRAGPEAYPIHTLRFEFEIANEKPKTLEQLRVAAANRSVDPHFLAWPSVTAGQPAT